MLLCLRALSSVNGEAVGGEALCHSCRHRVAGRRPWGQEGGLRKAPGSHPTPPQAPSSQGPVMFLKVHLALWPSESRYMASGLCVQCLGCSRAGCRVLTQDQCLPQVLSLLWLPLGLSTYLSLVSILRHRKHRASGAKFCLTVCVSGSQLTSPRLFP